MAKNYQFRADQIKPLAVRHGTCIASDEITVEGKKVGYMYRQAPRHDNESGWVFLSGQESQEWLDNPTNFEVFDVNTIANCDPDIIPFLDAPVGSAMVRDPESELFEPDFGPDEFLEQEASPSLGTFDPHSDVAPDAVKSGPPAPAPVDMPDSQPMPEFCDACGKPLDPDEAEFRSKTETTLLGGQPAYQLALCPKCANSHDGTSSRMIGGMAIFVGVVVLLGLSGWILSACLR